MSASRPVRLTVVYEFAGREEQMMHGLVEALLERAPELHVKQIGGLFLTYRQGGLRIERLANLLWVYVSTAIHLSLCRPDAVIVHTSPPGIQLWTVAWAAIGKVPVICWLMDYHPEIEARALEKRGLRAIATLLRRIDGYLMPRFAAIVTLDSAMSSLACKRAPETNIIEHPTWTLNSHGIGGATAHTPGSRGDALRLVYAGNLGLAHNLEPLSRLLELVRKRRMVTLLLIGTSCQGVARFRAMAEKVGVVVEARPRVHLYSELGLVYEQGLVDAGIVVLAKELAGLVSPSKFAGYIDFGLPVVYLGPAETSSALICSKFRGGFWIPPDDITSKLEIAASGLLDEHAMATAVAGARSAAKYFQGFCAASLAAVLVPCLRKLVVESIANDSFS